MRNNKLIYGIIILLVFGLGIFGWDTYRKQNSERSIKVLPSPLPEITFNSKVYVPAKCFMPAITPVKKIGTTKEGFEVFNSVVTSPKKDLNILLKRSDGKYQCYTLKPDLEQKTESKSTSVPIHVGLSI
jgi:hypothetical protein